MAEIINWFNWIIENKEIIKIFYGLIILLICIIIVFKTDKLFRLSLYQGIRYFRNAFFFYGIAFIIRYFLGISFFYDKGFVTPDIVKFFFEFFLIMAGFFLFYSLIWKKIGYSQQENSPSSLFNRNLFIFYIMTLIIVFLDYLWQTYFFMFLSQIMLFACLSVISFINYQKKGLKHKFLKFYFIAMVLSFIAWLLNAVLALYLNWNKGILINIYILNIIFFLLFLYGIINVTRRI